MKKHSGSCLCDSIRYSFTGPLNDVWFCHCSQCRKNYGMYGAFVGTLLKDFKMNKSKYLKSYKASKNTTRTFCGKCASPITWYREGTKRIYVLAGLLKGKARITNAKHIYTKDRGGYYKICDRWKQYKIAPK